MLRQLWDSKLFQLILLAGLLVFSFYLFVLDVSSGIMIDFEVYVRAAKKFAAGEPFYGKLYPAVSHDGKYFELSYFYPPFLAVLLSPFAAFNLESLRFGWACVNYLAVLAVVGALASFARSFLPERRFLELFVGLLFFLVCFEPLYWGLQHGQINTIILLLLTGALVLPQQNRSFLGGTCLAGAALLKISPVLLVLGALRFKDSRFIAGFLGTALVATLLLLVGDAGRAALGDFLSSFGHLAEGNVDRDLVFNFALDKALLSPLGLDGSSAARWVLRLAEGAVALGVVLRFRSQNRFVLEAILICFLVLFSPMLWFHHLLWLVLPLFVLALHSPEGDREERLRHWTFTLGIFFLLSQTNLIHYQGMQLSPSLLKLTVFVPALGLSLLSVLLFRVGASDSRAG